MDNKRNVATKTLLVLSCAFLLGLTSCTKKHHPSSDTTSSAPISETTSESTSETTSDVTTSEGTSDSTTSEVPSSDVSSESTSSEDPSSDVSSEDASSEESSSEEVLLDFGENVKLNDKTVTYNGEEQTLTVENLPEGAVVTYEGTHKFTNAGEYTIRATVSKEGYNDKVVSAKLTIAKAKVEVPTAKTNLVYTGEAIVGVEANALCTVTGGSAVEAGTHEATVTLKDTNNYEWASEFDGKVTYTIAKAEISVSGVTAPEMSVVDTGSAINFVVNGVPSNVKATVTYYSDEAMTTPVSEARGVGVYFVKVELSSTSANHTLVGTTTLTSKLTIRENNTGVTFAGDEFTYDGTAKTITVDMTNAKADGNFEVTYFSNEACTEAFTAATKAGTYTVYAKVVDKNEVYSTTVLQATLTINKVAVKVVVANKEITYNQDVPAFTYEVQGLVNGETAENVIKGTPTYTCAYAKGSNVGTYDITLTGLSTDNYELAYYKGTLTVNKAEVNVPEAKAGLVYNGTTLVGVEENALYTVTNGSATNAGTYTATVTLKDTVNYKWANAEFDGNVEFEIAKADLDVSNVAVTGLGEKDATAYNGEAKVATVTGLPEGLSASVKYYSDAEHTTEVTECKNAGTYYVEVTFTQADTDNYNLASIDPITGELVIKQKVLSVTWDGATEYFYDGTEKAIPTCTIDKGQVITGDEVTLKVIGEPTIKFVGDYGWKLALEGAQSVNYEIDYENISYQVTIFAPQQNVLSDWSELLAEDFTSGEYALVFGKDTTYYALTNNITSTGTISSNICGDSFVSGDEAQLSSSNIWTITKVENGYYIQAGEKYLSYSSTSKTSLTVKKESEATVWSIGEKDGNHYFYASTRALTCKDENTIGFYATSNLGQGGYSYISLYKIAYEEPVTLTVEEVSESNGSMTVVSSTEQLSNLVGSVDTLSITITPAAHKMLVSLEVVDNEGKTLETLVTTKNEDGTYTYDKVPSCSGTLVATFGDAVSYSVSQSTLENGVISDLLENYYAGETVSFTVTPNATYYIKNVVVKDASDTEIECSLVDGKYIFVMPESNVNVSVEIAKQPAVTLEQSANGTFVVKQGETALESGALVDGNSKVTVVATPNPAYVVDQVLVNGTPTSETTITITGDTTIKVTYKLMDTTSIADILALTDSDKGNYYLVEGTIKSLGTQYKQTIITDGTNDLVIYQFSSAEEHKKLSEGDKVLLYGDFTIFKTTYEIQQVKVIDCLVTPSVSYIDGTKLVWEGNATSYDVYYGTETADTLVSSNVEGNELDLSTVEGLSLTANSSYVFKVVAHKTSVKGHNWELTGSELSCVYNASYTITYKYNDDATPDGTLSNVTKVTLPETDPTRAGYVFEGWFTDAACTSAAVSGEVLTGNLVLYAKWASEGQTTVNISMIDVATSKKLTATAQKTGDYTTSDGKITISYSPYDTGNTGKMYGSVSGGVWTAANLRLYASESAKLLITSDSSVKIVSIKITYTGNALSYKGTNITSDQVVSIGSATAEFAVTGTSKNTQVTAIEVIYE